MSDISLELHEAKESLKHAQFAYSNGFIKGKEAEEYIKELKDTIERLT